MNKNIIQKTILDLHYNGSTDGIALQKNISEWANEQLLKLLDVQLQKVGNNDTLIKIDRLDIEIDLSEKGDMTEQLSRKMNEQLSYELNKIIGNKGKEDGMRSIRLSVSFAEEILFFIEYGNLPWWSKTNNQRDLFKRLQIFIENAPDSKFISSLKALAVNENIQKRIVWQIPDSIFYKFIYWIAPPAETYLQDLKKEVDKIRSIVTQQEATAIELIFKSSVLTSINKQSNEAPLEPIIRSFLERAGDAGFESVIKEKISKTNMPVLKKYFSEANQEIPNKILLKEKELIIISDLENKSKINEEKSVSASEGIYINNAGLVIIAGFLPHFFKRIGILNDNIITEKNKATCLVQFLASGIETVAEFELGISKLLCGIEIDEAINTSIVLSEKEKEEANELLLSASEYWNVLRDTSVQGFRESFLMRNGKLWFENEEWHLHVEQKPYDMLLQQLPWNINIIRLPWMRYPLRTEWPY